MPDEKLIHEYEIGGEKLRNAVKGLLPQDLLAYPVPGTWSIQEIVIHLMDSDLIATDRMKRIIAMEHPQLIAFHESLFIEKLFPAEQNVDDAVTIFDLNRRMFAKVLRKLAPDAWDRSGHHNERGNVTLYEMLKLYVWHLDHHLKFIVDKREKLGKIMW
jgi:hypothetical protein